MTRTGIDILPQISGVDFDSAWERRVEDVIDAETDPNFFQNSFRNIPNHLTKNSPTPPSETPAPPCYFHP